MYVVKFQRTANGPTHTGTAYRCRRDAHHARDVIAKSAFHAWVERYSPC